MSEIGKEIFSMNAKELKVHICWPSWKTPDGSEKMCITATMDGQRIEGLPQNTSYEEINSAFYAATGVFLPSSCRFGYYYSRKKAHGLARGVYNAQTRCYKWEAMDRTYEEDTADLCSIIRTLSSQPKKLEQLENKLKSHFSDLVWMPTTPEAFCDMLREFAGINPETNEHREEERPVEDQSSTARPAADVIVCVKGGMVQSAYAKDHGVTVNFDVIDLDMSNSPDDSELDEQGQNLEMISRIEHDSSWKAIY